MSIFNQGNGLERAIAAASRIDTGELGTHFSNRLEANDGGKSVPAFPPDGRQHSGPTPNRTKTLFSQKPSGGSPKEGNAVIRAIVYDRFGSIGELHLGSLDRPEPKEGEVLIEIRATSVNVLDSRIRNGLMGPLVNKKFPRVPGIDLAGVVAAIGAGVTDLRVGDAVFGATDPFKGGAFAEFAAVPTAQLALKPEGLSFEQAAALPAAGLAALYSMRDLGRVRAGSEVLIHGASGAVGLHAVQIAKAMGARVTAVAGTGGVAVVREGGADIVIDYKTGDGNSFGKTFDVILNASGKLPFSRAKRYLNQNGRLIEPSPTIPVFIGSKLANPFRKKKHLVLQTFPRRVDLEKLAGMWADGSLKVTIAGTYPIDQAKAAFAAMENGGMVGKVIVTL